ncbi:MAG: hypothetical protein IT480_06435 [Gammaproteobacteria bacterium]|nr:hypothetical protein [Gammaproteobacteria bacterium]
MAFSTTFGTTVQGSSGAAITMGAPASIADGDLLIAVVNSASSSVTISISGFTAKANRNTTNRAGTQYLLYKYASSESGDYSTNAAGGVLWGCVMCVKGAVTSGDPFDGVAQNDKTNSGTTMTCGAISPATSGDLIVAVYQQLVNGASHTSHTDTGAGASWTESMTEAGTTNTTNTIATATWASSGSITAQATTSNSGYSFHQAFAIKAGAAAGAALESTTAAVSALTGALTTAIQAAASAAAVAALTAALTTGIPLATAPAAASALSADLTTSITAAAAPAASATLTAGLSTGIVLAAAPAGAATVTATLAVPAAALEATPAAAATATGALSTEIRLSSAPVGVAALTAGLTTAITLQGAPASAASVSAGLTTGIPLQAAPASVATVTAALEGGAALVSSPQGAATVAADLTTAILCAAAPAAQASLTATLDAPVTAIEAAPQAASSLTAGLTSGIRVAAVAAGQATLAAGLSTQIPLAATLAGQASLDGALQNAAGVIVVSAPGVAQTQVLAKPGIKSISAAFDQNMRIAVAYDFHTGAPPEFYWFDNTLGYYVTLVLPPGSITPRCGLDDSRDMQVAGSDIILTYLRAGTLYFREQRDRFTVEYTLKSGLEGYELAQFGMNRKYRLQWQLVPEPMEGL